MAELENNRDDNLEPVESAELQAFENEVDEVLATGALDEALRVVDDDGVAQVLPVLDTEPVSHLLQGIEEIGGKGNVLVSTHDGIVVLSIAEYSPQTDTTYESADAVDDVADDGADDGIANDDNANIEEHIITSEERE